jgi:ATP-binding cassette subfamily F protein 3
VLLLGGYIFAALFIWTGVFMALISVTDVSMSYGGEPLLKNVSLQLQRGQKAALVGPNGAGKTTLLKIIAGELEPETGSVIRGRDMAVGYLPQEPRLPKGVTLRAHLEMALGNILNLKEQIRDLEEQMTRSVEERAAGGSLQGLMERYGRLLHQFEESGGYQAESRLAAVARGLGFTPADLDRETAYFSGGQKTRANLAALLLQQPDLLLLDEPTNYLDLDGLEWLERYLQDWPGSILVVSHDRFFLDRVVEKVFLLHQGRISSYNGNYSAFARQREQENRSRERAYRKQQSLLQKEEAFIRESKGDERSKRQARSRQKRLNKMELLERPPGKQSFKPGFAYAGRSGRLVISFEAVFKAFGDRQLFKDLSFEIFRGDRVALVGPNGAGKTTLLKLIAGEEQPTGGRIRIGPSVRVTYFSQEQEEMNPQHTVLEEIMSAGGLNIKQARNHLGKFLFKDDRVFQTVDCLSGGEKSRLALARLALSDSNCLLMDEPTSHLDLPSLEELEKALQGYQGTLIVVSHDRYFLSTLVNRVIELQPGAVFFFQGGYPDYLQAREKRFKDRKAVAASAGGVNDKQRRAAALYRRQAREQQRLYKKLEKRQLELEEIISLREQEIVELEEQLSDPEQYGDYHRVTALNEQLQEARDQVSALIREWEQVGLKLEQVKKQA